MTQLATILIKGHLAKTLMEQIQQHYKTYKLWEQADPKAFLKDHGHEITALVTSGVYGADQTLINALPNLKLISSFGVGYDAIDINYAKQKNIIVTNTPDVLNDCVADLALSLLLDIARGISAADRFVRAGKWQPGKTVPLGCKPGGKTCGIVGLGRIGKAIAKRAEAFGMKIAYYGRHPQQEVTYPYYSEIIELAKASDFLVIVVPGGNETLHLINHEVLTALGRNGYLINIARGSVIDEEALVNALQQGTIAGAGLDVYAHEPNVPQELFSLDNVVLLPHIGSATTDTRQAMGELVFNNLTSFIEGKGAITPVN